MQGKITKRAVDALHTRGADVALWDTTVKGFGVRARAGGTKTYLVRYRPGAGGRGAPLRTYTLGAHGSPWTPDTARTEAKRILGLVEDGKDPAADRASARAAPTVKEFAARYLAEHVETKRKSRTRDEYRRLIDKLILPEFGSRRAMDLSARDVSKLHHALKSTPYQANRVLAVLSAMMTFAEREGIRPNGSNPCRHVERFEETKRERMLSAHELAVLGEAIEAYDGSEYAAAAVKLLVFTGARVSEILGLRWEWVDFELGEARLPDTKTGAKTLHFPPPALAVLGELAREEGNPYVIVGGVAKRPLADLEKPWQAIREAASIRFWRTRSGDKVGHMVTNLEAALDRAPTVAECYDRAKRLKLDLPPALTDLRLHDLRHAFASVAASSGMGLPIIGKLLGHTQAATTARYAHLASDPVKAAASAIAGKIAGAMRAGGGAQIEKLRK